MHPSAQPPFWRSYSFALTLGALAALALVPELIVFVHNHAGLKKALPICYYEFIVSFLLFLPAWWLPRALSRLWVILAGAATAVATLIVGFQAVSIGARWDLTAHAALMQTYTRQALDFSRFFSSPGTLITLLGLTAGFVICLVLNTRASGPSRRQALVWTLCGLLFSAYGVHNFLIYGRHVIKPTRLDNGTVLPIAGVGPNSYHPLLRLAATHYNYRVTHDFYINAYRDAALHRDELAGARPVADAALPRIVLVVIGESAGRRHWSLYGYPRETTPELGALRDELFVYRDAVSNCVGTQAALRAMMETTADSQPVFPLFTQAGYTTHWYSAKPDQGIFDVEIGALVQSCDERRYLNGAYDENLLPLVRAAIAAPGRHIIFVNLFGSHVRYRDRYPASFDVFHGETGPRGNHRRLRQQHPLHGFCPRPHDRNATRRNRAQLSALHQRSRRGRLRFHKRALSVPQRQSGHRPDV